jgi:hypothetical protein
MRYYQDALMSDTRNRIDVEAANQQGKSFSLCVKASVKFLRDHGKNTYTGLISKSQAQNSMNMRMIRKMLKEANVTYTPGSNDNLTVMVHDLGNGYTNTLVCSVASTGALGYPFNWLLLDEFEFWENPEGLEYMWDQILEPRTFQTKGQIIIYSNPNGKNFVSENLHKRKVGDDYQFHVYNINFLDNPDNDREQWDLKKAHTHPIIFASTMGAQRTESEGAALNEKDIQLTYDDDVDRKGFYGIDKNTSNYWFLDLGFVNDQSCLVGGYITKNEKNETQYNFAVKVYPQAHPHTELWGREDSDEDSVPSIVNRFGGNNAMFELDLTGKEGNEILAHQAGLGCSGVKMTGPWKATHYERFIGLVKQGRIKVQRIDNWLDSHNKNFAFQARSLRINTKLPDGRSRPYPLYHHTTEKDHDDILDAIVGCLSLMDEELIQGDSYEFSLHSTELKKDEKGNKISKDIEGHNFDENVGKAKKPMPKQVPSPQPPLQKTPDELTRSAKFMLCQRFNIVDDKDELKPYINTIDGMDTSEALVEFIEKTIKQMPVKYEYNGTTREQKLL